MEKKLMVTAEEIAIELSVSKSFAYNLIKRSNGELAKKGYITIPGRDSRRYYEEKLYGKAE